MIEHVIRARDGLWDVVAKGTGVEPDTIVETFAHEVQAKERMHRLNGRQLRAQEGPMIGAKENCKCRLGVAWEICGIEGHT